MAKLIIVSGLPASGKSTLSVQLGKEMRLPVFSKDDFKELFADTIGFSDHESTLPLEKASLATLFFAAKKCIENGSSVIIESNFSLDDETKAFISSLEQTEIEVYEILCYADGQILIDRFIARKRHPIHHTLDDASVRTYLEKNMRKGKNPPLQAGRLLEVDTTDPSNIKYDQIISFIVEE